MKYDNYEKISDIIYSLDNITHLCFTTKLYTKNKDDFYVPMHQEFQYKKSGYRGNVGMIRRKLEYYLSIDRFKTQNSDRISVTINPWDFPLFQTMLNKASEWFNSPEYSGLYKNVNGSLKISMNIQPLQIKTGYNDFIGIEPSVIGRMYPGVRIFLNQNTSVNIFVNNFTGLLYTINNFNMVMYAAIMLNYLQRPDYGYNNMSFNRYEDEMTSEAPTEAIKPGSRNTKKNESFLDKMNKIQNK